MTLKLKKKPMAAVVSTDIEDLAAKDKLTLVKAEYRVAVEASPDYDQLKAEIETYKVNLLSDPDIPQLSAINKLYAETQSYSSRVTAIEVLALDNASRWKRMVVTMEGYIEDLESDLIVSPKYEDLTIPKAHARVKVELKKEYNILLTLRSKSVEAESFCKMITVKKKDLSSILTTLGKQVKALSLEQMRG
jgi:hypothetical protein